MIDAGIVGMIGFVCGSVVGAILVADYYARFYHRKIQELHRIHAERLSDMEFKLNRLNSH